MSLKNNDVPLAKNTVVSNKRMTAAQQKAEDLSDCLDAFEESVIRNWKPIVAALVLIAVVVLLFLLVKDYRQKKEINANNAYAQVVKAEDFERAWQNFGACAAANSARMKLAQTFKEAKDYSRQASYLVDVVNDNDEDMYVRIKCAIEAGYIFELAEKWDEALQQFDSVLSNVQTAASQRSEAAYAKALLLFNRKEYENASDALLSVDPASAWNVNAKSLQEKISKFTVSNEK